MKHSLLSLLLSQIMTVDYNPVYPQNALTYSHKNGIIPVSLALADFLYLNCNAKQQNNDNTMKSYVDKQQ